MKQAAKQIFFCALALILVCALSRLVFFRSYTAHIPVFPRMERDVVRERSGVTVEAGNEVVRLGEGTWNNGYFSVPIHPGKAGEAELRILDENGEKIGFHFLRVSPLGTVYDLQTGGFTGDIAVLIAVTLFWLFVSAVMIWHYFQAKGSAYYAYSTIYFAGFSLFSLSTGLLMLILTVSHMLNPAGFSMYSAYGIINGASKQFMVLTMPAMAVFAIALAVSNVELLRHQKPQLKNLLGLLVAFFLLAGEGVGVFLFFRDFMGSEWEGRIQNTLENVFATVFVYFECMLVGSVICGIKASKHQPERNKDFIIILGCWFRKDGTLPPLLRGRVDKAISFWRQQKKETGKEAILIPSGGQGRDETMPEAEAMRRYIVSNGIPENRIQVEPNSKNTFQNMAFSKALIEKMQPDGKTLFATTNYHVFRSGLWANLAGLHAEGIGGKTVWWYWPNAFMRECAGLLQKRWKQEVLLLILLMAFFGLLSIVLG